jgi:protein O-GlcNAc transferase
MPTSHDALRRAIQQHQAGQIREAEVLYAQVLAAEPNHSDALHLMGLIAYQTGRYEAAVDLIRRAVAIAGDQPVFLGNLGEAYRAMGKLDEAEVHLRQALRRDGSLADAHNSLGNVLRCRGQTNDATAAFREAVRLRPTFAEAHNNLGAMLQTAGDLSAAMIQYDRAIELNPNYAGAYNNLGLCRKALGNLEGACAAYERGRVLDPNNPDILINLATAYQGLGKAEQAIITYREVLGLTPDAAWVHNSLGTALVSLGLFDDAVACYREAIRLQPNLGETHFNLGVALYAQGNRDGAAAAYRDALRITPSLVKAISNLAFVMAAEGRLDESLALCQRAIVIDPNYAKAHLDSAHLYRATKQIPESIASFGEALRLRPDYAEAYNGLAMLYIDFGRMEEAIECCLTGIEPATANAALHANLAVAMQNLGRLDEAVVHGRRSVELNPGGAAEHSNLLYRLLAHPGYDAATIFAEHRAWGARHADPLTALAPPHSNDLLPDRRLRVGYVSPYFRDHAVNFFTEPILTEHDHTAFEIFCYSDVRDEDAITNRLQACADHWRATRALTDEQLAEMVRSDAIDILVDLTGHISGSRLLAFARKPAPIQVTYIGYQGTTGMRAMDYRLTDEWADPPGRTDAYHTETLIRLPRSFFCYRPPDEAPPVSPLPVVDRGTFTFGSFNNFTKIGPTVVDAWLEMLARVERSRLIVLTHAGSYLRDYFHERARARGVDPARIELCAKRPRREYLDLIAQADIALDPFPFNGHTTTCDCIWMGVPVVMLAGQTYASRFGGSVLVNVGLERWIADSRDAYVDLAVSMADEGNRAELTRLRAELRPRMAASPLLDFEGFARNIEAAYRTMWRTWIG